MSTLDLGPGRVWIAPVGSDPRDTEAWRELGTVDTAALSGLAVSALTVDDDEARWAPSVRMPGPVTVSFTGRLTWTGRALLFGDVPMPNRRRIRAVTRHKYRARARRRS